MEQGKEIDKIVDTVVCDITAVPHSKSKTRRIVTKALQDQGQYYEKELAMADAKWKSNEEYRIKYMDGYEAEKIECDRKLQEQREGILTELESIGSYESRHGGGEFSAGYKKALEDVITKIKNHE